jgi:hypothetical protein
MESSGGDAVASNIEEHVVAIRLCLDNHLHMPALALVYCGIDVLANLCRPVENSEVKPSDFVGWAERYMECQRYLGVSGIDLYGARCGILHTYTMDSRLSAKGHAKRILYAWGNRNPDDAMKVLSRLELTEIVIKIEQLFEAFLYGIGTFGKAIDDDPKLRSIVTQRGRKLFRDQTSFPGIEGCT